MSAHSEFPAARSQSACQKEEAPTFSDKQEACADKRSTRLDKRNWRSFFDVLRDVVFASSFYLSTAEQLVLMFIFRRTRMYGKEWEKIPLRHFTEGVWSRNAGDVCSRLILKTNTVIGALKHLRDKGLIEVREHDVQAYQYRIREADEINRENMINYVQAHQPKQLNAMLIELRRNSKRLPSELFEALQAMEAKGPLANPSARRPLSPGPQRPLSLGIRPKLNKPNMRLVKKPISNLAPQAGATRGDNSLSKNTAGGLKLPAPKKSEFRSPGSNSSPQSQELNTAFALLENQRAARRERRLGSSNPQAWIDRWSEAVSSLYPDVAHSVRDRTFRDLKLALRDCDIPLSEMPAFVTWIVRRWTHLRRSVFSYSPNKSYGPPAPDLTFVIRHLHRVYAEYSMEVIARLQTQHRIAQHRKAAAPPATVDLVKAEAVRNSLDLPKWE